LTGAVIAVPVMAEVALIGFELLLIYKLWLSTRSFEREMARSPPPTAAPALAPTIWARCRPR
jgi:hypothetical protein